MASLNLLDINVDALFEQHNISEIDQIHKMLQQNIEEKKEELRMMVGERYRDLLQAADTIGNMRVTSTTVIGHVDGIMSSCRTLNEHQLIGFKMPTTTSVTDVIPNVKLDKITSNYYGIIAQIRLLTVLPELIWSRLDAKDYFVATQLFIFSRHISTGLQLDINNDLMRKFPIAKRQWAILSQFFFTLKHLCLEQLERRELQADTAAKCLASLLLLENCQMDKLLTIFIQLRSKAFRQALTVDELVSSEGTQETQPHRVKDKILASLKVLSETVCLVHQCFIGDAGADGEHCHLVDELTKLTAADAKPTISLIDLDDSFLNGTLPPLIAKFKPHILVKPLDSDFVKRSMEGWLQTTEKDTKNHLKSLINIIGSVRTIHGIKKSAFELGFPSNWSVILRGVHMPSDLDFYTTYYQPLISSRLKEIVRSSWRSTIEQTEKEISDLLESAENNWTLDHKSFWTEDHSDVPLSLKQALDTNKQSHKLLMKTKGFSTDICNVCNVFDQNLEALFKDLQLYLTTTGGEFAEVENKGDQEKVIEFLRECTKDGLTELISNIKSSKSSKRTQESLIFLARLLKALTEICPNLKLCLTTQTSTTPSSTNWEKRRTSIGSGTTAPSNHLEQWDRIGRLIDEESINLWKEWIEVFVADLLTTKKGNCFDVELTLIDLLTLFPNWDTITVEEKDEQNQPIQSTIRVPCQPSVPLQEFLFECCSRLNDIVPNTLPRTVTILLTERLIVQLKSTYTALARDDALATSNQNAAMQFYFDVKFLNLMFVGGRRIAAGGSTLAGANDDLQQLANSFKSLIDPFDFELFHPFVTANVKRTALRMQFEFGALVPNFEYLSSILAPASGAPSGASGQDKDPNVMALSVSGSLSNWFPLLPIVVPKAATAAIPRMTEGKSSGRQEKAKSRKSPQKTSAHNSNSGQSASTASTTQQNLANVKSNAAAFFGAMSQDWFR